jgi:drug/metabolite transporter (DMT)-like permease
MRDRTPVLAAVALVVGGTLAGGNAVGIRFTNRELEPLFGAGARFALASMLLLVVARTRHLVLPRGRALLGTVVFGALNFAGAFGFGYYALVHIKAGVGSTLLALTPLVTLGLAAAHRYERVRRDGIVGGVLAVVGVAVISNASLSGSVPALAAFAALASVVCFAEAAVLIRRFPPVDPIMTNALAMGVGAVLLLGFSAIAGERWSVPERAQTWIALAYLVVAGSIVVFLLYLYVLRRWEASRAVYFDVLIPPVALALSAWLDDEAISGGLVVGGALVLVGAYVGAMRHAGETR